LQSLEENGAVDLAKSVLGLDDSIIAVGVVSHTGKPLAGVVKPGSKNIIAEDPHLWQGFAFRAATMMASAITDDKLFSKTDSLVLIRKNSKILFMYLPSRASIIVVFFPREKRAHEINDHLIAFFGLGE
jgi:hypothetical protein